MYKTIIIAALLIAVPISADALPSRRSNRPRSNPEYWWLCPVDRTLPARPEYTLPEPEEGTMEAHATTTRVVEKDVTDFDDDVEIVQDDRALRADHVVYDQPANTLRAFGNVHAWDPSLLWRGERAQFDLNTKIYSFDRGKYWLLDSPGRGQASSIVTNQVEHFSWLTNALYTTCPAGGKDPWQFKASRIMLDHDAERGVAHNATLRVHDIPVFYLPYVSFPLTNTRKSGFLVPTFGTSTVAGADLRMPYYFNLAPNYDAVLTPRYISNRGLMMMGIGRYLGEHFKDELKFSYLPNDTLAKGNDRSSLYLRHEQIFDERRGYLYVLLENVSDTKFLEDFGGSLGVTSTRYVDRKIEANWLGRWLSVYGIMQAYQNVDSTIPEAFGPYRRLPQVILQTQFMQYHLRPHFFMLTDIAYFDRANTVSGGRIGLEPTISLPFIRPWLYMKPAIGLRQTNYFLTNPTTFQSDVSRMAPVLSNDVQLFAERRFNFMNTPLLQTLEPRAYYVLIPKVHQSDIPVFDSGLYDFTFATLFLENRFSGRDRIGDANQLALGVTSRFLNLDNGREVLRASLGQIEYFRPREIRLAGTPLDSTATSEIVTELSVSPTEDWSARMTLQLDPEKGTSRKSALTLRYAPRDGLLLNASYRLRGTQVGVINPIFARPQDVEQTDLSFRLPLTENLSLIGRWNYSLKGQESLETVAGAEYENCCWGFRIFSRRYLRNVQGQFDSAIFMQVEFKGLGGIGNSAATFLRRNLPGYEPMF